MELTGTSPVKVVGLGSSKSCWKVEFWSRITLDAEGPATSSGCCSSGEIEPSCDPFNSGSASSDSGWWFLGPDFLFFFCRFSAILAFFCCFSASDKMYSFFIPISKHFFNRHLWQNRRVITVTSHSLLNGHLNSCKKTRLKVSIYRAR